MTTLEQLNRMSRPDMIAVVEKLELQLAAQQAKIDRLMLEYCPEDMTAEQKEIWARYQVPVSDEVQAEIDKALEQT